MEDFTARTYGDRIAGVYDLRYASYDPRAISTLATLARSGPALELGIGTGRIALPLQEKGVPVAGIDASAAMVERLRSKPGGERLPVTIGDFADVPVEGRFALIYVLFNTFFALLTQADQIRCFANVARHLEPDGTFLIEAFVPDLARFHGHQEVRATHIAEDGAAIDVTRVDPSQQLVTSQHIEIGTRGIELYPLRIRYAWPSELDLMAQLAGLRLEARWADWAEKPFAADSTNHISLYGLAT